MGPRVLILLWVGVASAFGAGGTPEAPARPARAISDSVRADSALPSRRDSSATSRPRRPLPPAWRDDVPAWGFPAKAGSAGGAIDQAYRDGAFGVPWRVPYEFEGMYETWVPWTGLPLEERVVRAAWDGPALAGAGDAGPLAGSAIVEGTRSGLGGVARREILPERVPTDTPLTALHFFRGALASYRFGLDFSRAVWGPWGIQVSSETRSAQSRAWVYRDQIQDLFQGTFGRTREDLPARGHSPGQDDQQWEIVLVRGDSTSRLDIGWTWVDLLRGIPDPAGRWGGGDPASFAGRQSRSGGFWSWRSNEDDWQVRADFRDVSETWSWRGWSDSGGPVPVSGDVSRMDGELSLRRGTAVWGWGVRGQGSSVSGSRAVPGLIATVEEDQERAAAFADGRIAGLSWSLEGGWTRLSNSENGLWQRPDGRAQLAWGDSIARFSFAASHQNILPDERSERPDPVLLTRPASDLVPEIRDLVEVRGRLPLPFALRLDAGAAFLARQHAHQGLAVPGPGGEASRGQAFSLADAGQTLGGSAELGVGWSSERWSLRSMGSWGWTGLPEQGLSGRDPRLPRWRSRSNLGWRRGLLDGRLQLRWDADVRAWGESWAWTSSAQDPAARAVRLPPSSQIDLELQVGIRSFWIDWWIENLLDSRQTPAPGWTPPGVRAGWGIQWNFGG